jgi:hypothetical protein
MAFSRTGGGEGISGTNTRTATNNAAVAVGDTIIATMTWDFSSGATFSTVTDQLGNSYAKVISDQDAGDTQQLETWISIATHAGTPTVTATWVGSPTFASILIDSFSGSDTSSTTDGSGSQVQALPTTATDAVRSAASGNEFNTTVNQDLVYGVSVNPAGGADPGTVGTGFSAGGVGTGNPIIRSEFRTQSTAGATVATFTTTNNSAHITIAIAVKPAGGGGGGGSAVDDDPGKTPPMRPWSEPTVQVFI